MKIEDKRTIKVQLEMPTKWLEESQGEGFLQFLGQIRERFADRVFDKAVEKVLSELEIPEVKIDPKEIKDRMLDIMAKRALDNQSE